MFEFVRDRLGPALLAAVLLVPAVSAQEPDRGDDGAAADAVVASWRPQGLVRVRDMTPFGILRLDLLPAHAVTAAPGAWGLEANLTWQNTYVMSGNVESNFSNTPDIGITLQVATMLGET